MVFGEDSWEEDSSNAKNNIIFVKRKYFNKIIGLFFHLFSMSSIQLVYSTIRLSNWILQSDKPRIDFLKLI